MTTHATAPASAAIDRAEQLVRHPLTKFAAVGALGWSIWSADDSGPVLCPFRRCTGGYCPGCGATRGAARLMRGDVSGSWAQHPIVVLFAVQGVLAGVFFALRRDLRPHWRSVLRPFFAANLVALLLLWVIRLATGAVPVPFA